ncbi:MAG: flp pilus-assembly TadE/G-like family protein [Streptomycetaceae bacterium]|nr:flp pilus-assembly TadE/G-like family protein [Streptomycetaceae bacterium]
MWALLPICLAMTVLAFGAAVGTRHRTATAADAAALAAASHADQGAHEACAAATAIARDQGATLIRCVLHDNFADVTAQSRPPPLLRPFGSSRVPARAGPS